MQKLTVKDVPVNDKRVLVRVDFNVPLENGKVVDDARIRASLPTILYLVQSGARVILISHLGRPKGQIVESLRLDAVSLCLTDLLGQTVKKVDQVVGKEVEKSVSELGKGEVMLLENVRFEPGEEKNDAELAQKLADLADIFVNDAFGAVHRAHASTEGVANLLPAVAGFLLEKEVNELQHCLHNPERPFTAIFGGAKVSDKIGVIRKFLDLADHIIIGGGMANTFLVAKGYDMASSFYERLQVDLAVELLEYAEKCGSIISLPEDLVIVEDLKEEAPSKVVNADSVSAGWQSVDVGPSSVEAFSRLVEKSRKIVWNGPLGVFEVSPFYRGTEAVARAAIESDAYLLVGGGDTAAAFEKFGLVDQVDHVSTGGGATLEFLEGKDLPGISVLKDSY